MPLHLSEAQQLFDALNDVLCRKALDTFVYEQAKAHMTMLISEIHKRKERDFYKESELKGKVEAYETMMSELKHFAERQLIEASQ